MDEEKKTEGTPAVTTTDTVDWKAKYDQVLADKTRLFAEAETWKAKASRYESGVRQQVEARVFEGLVDPDLRKLAPAIELDDTGDITSASAELINKWKSEKPHFFGQSVRAEETEQASQNQQPERKPVPPAGNGTGKQTVAWFENLAKTNPTEFRRKEVQSAYIRALNDAEQNKRK